MRRSRTRPSLARQRFEPDSQPRWLAQPQPDRPPFEDRTAGQSAGQPEGFGWGGGYNADREWFEREERERQEAARKAAEDEEKEKAHAKQIADMSAEIAALKTTLAAPGVAAAVKAVATGSDKAAGEGGQESGAVVKMTASEALAAYNKIDANDAKARADFRTAHAAELGLKNRR
jgi:hypothetical protein